MAFVMFTKEFCLIFVAVRRRWTLPGSPTFLIVLEINNLQLELDLSTWEHATQIINTMNFSMQKWFNLKQLSWPLRNNPHLAQIKHIPQMLNELT